MVNFTTKEALIKQLEKLPDGTAVVVHTDDNSEGYPNFKHIRSCKLDPELEDLGFNIENFAVIEI